MCACAEPYLQAEEFWSTMMFGCIPSYEEYADSLKRKYGDNPKLKQRPISFGSGFGTMPIFLSNRKAEN